MGDISKRYPNANFDVQALLTRDEVASTIVDITADEVGVVLQDLINHFGISELALIQENDCEATVHIEASAFGLFVAAKRGGVPIEMPVEIYDETAIAELSGVHDRLPNFFEHLDEQDLEYDIECIQQRQGRTDQLLTDTQKQIMLTAIELGYYDTPRNCTQEEIAEALGIAKSTCNGVLNRAEAAIVKEHIESLPTDTENTQNYAPQ